MKQCMFCGAEPFGNKNICPECRKKFVGGAIAVAIAVILLVLLILFSRCRHVWAEATCTTPATCTECGVVKEGSQALGHQFEPATCQKRKTCRVCGLIEGEREPHSFTDATCTEPSRCTQCGGRKVGSKALGHDLDTWTVTKKATCTSVGERSGFCSRCNSDVTVPIAKVAHTGGRWEITEQATWSQCGTMERRCGVCNEVFETKTYELTESAFKGMCETYDYKEIARYPDKHMGDYAKFKGEVIQVLSEGNFYVLRVNVTYNKYGWYEDTIYVTYTAPAGTGRILEEDIVTMYGELCGEKTYETIFGGTVTIPSFEAFIIELDT